MSTESVRQFLSTVSSESALQVAQLSEDQLSEDELETVAGGCLNVLSDLPTKLTSAPGLLALGGCGSIPSPQLPGPIPGGIDGPKRN